MTITTLAVLAFVLLTLPVVLLLWATESPQQRARRWRASGNTYRSIAQRLAISETTARRWCAV